jgi:hypothetical protein
VEKLESTFQELNHASMRLRDYIGEHFPVNETLALVFHGA